VSHDGPVKAISSRDNPLLQRLRKLASDPAGYRKSGQVCLEGEHLCSAFVQRGGQAIQALVTETAWERPELRALAEQASAIALVPLSLMAGISTLESPPHIAFVVAWQPAEQAEPGLPSVVLDRLQDAGNVGAILRSASAFGFTQIIAVKGTAALWSPKVLRAGMGAHFGLRLVEAADESWLSTLHMPLLASRASSSAESAATPKTRSARRRDRRPGSSLVRPGPRRHQPAPRPGPALPSG